MSKRALRLVDHRLDRASRSCRGSARAPSPPRRAVVAVAHGADEAARPRRRGRRCAQRGASRATRSKSSCWIETRGGHRQPPVTGGKNADFAAVAQRRASVAHHLVERARARPCRAPSACGIGAAARDAARRAAPRRSRAGRLDRLAARAQRLAHRGEIAHVRPSLRSAPRAAGTHDVAARDRAARRVVDQAVGPDGGRQHARALVREQVERRRRRCGARAGTRGAGPGSASRSRRAAGMRRGATSSAPCSRSRNGRTSSRKVTKLDTGLPGRPMNRPTCRRRAAPRRTRAACRA